ncbi:MAG TPA: ABC transporter permease [Methylomirabilota bacterium]|nr:ABC transporter permease [Methylomirabilota bacterium]
MSSAREKSPRRPGRWRAAGLVIVLAVAVAAALAPALPLADPNRTQPSRRLAPPLAPGYPLGSDHLGRDLLSRVIWGARVSLVVGVVATLLAMLAGTAVGLVTGFYGGLTDNLVMRGIDLIMAFPYILLAMLLVAALGPGLVNAMIAVAVVNVSFYARGVRGAVLLLREQEFVEAARAVGSTEGRILRRHILPGIVGPILVFVSMNIGVMITESAGLSFIGLGAQPPTADWGTMLADGRQFITVAAHVAAIPGLAIFLLVLGCNLVGDGLRDALDPRLR